MGPIDEDAGAPILVVDDDPDVRMVVREVLAVEGFDITEAEGGDHALRLLASHSYAAVVLDRSMPGIDGIEVLRWLRRSPTTSLVPVLLLTGHTDPEDVVEGLGLGADDYLTKPFEPDELVARIRAHLRTSAEWGSLLDREIARREALMEAAGSTRPVEPLDQAALRLCDALVRMGAADGAGLVEVVGRSALPLACKGADPYDRVADERGGIEHLIRRAHDGPWLEPVIDTATALQTTVAVAPVIVDDALVALVLASASPLASRAGRDLLLSASIDIAVLAAGLLGTELRETSFRQAARRRFEQLIASHGYATLFQPVVDLRSREVVGFEALTRFEDDDTEDAFASAALAGVGHNLELHTLDAAVEAARELPGGLWVALNVSPSLVTARTDLVEVLDAAADLQLVLELSELEHVEDEQQLRATIDSFRDRVRWAVDDTGSGFASLARILALRADYVKLDRSWVHGVADDPAKRALIAGLQRFATETDARVIAEGIEDERELETLVELGIELGQGYLVAPPLPPDRAGR